MNFAITLECNKGCPYCFARETRNHDPEREMTLGAFKQYLAKLAPGAYVKLLGGEPTIHPHFKDFVEEALAQNREIVIISNFLFNDDVLEFIKSKIPTGKLAFLVNSTDLNLDNRIERFSKNYNEIYKVSYQYDREEYISCGITFINENLERYMAYLDFLASHLIKIERLRFSLNFPGSPEDKNKFFFLNNKDYGNLFLGMTNKCVSMGITPSIDCIVFPCMFSNKEEMKYLRKFAQMVRTKCEGPDAPSDIFPDGTISFCYPLRERIKVDTTKHSTLEEAMKESSLKYAVMESTITPPEICQSCEFKRRGFCNGPCMGFYK